MNWIARSSQRLDHKLLPVFYRSHWVRLSTRVGTLLTANSACIGLVFLLLLAAWTARSWSLTVQRMVRYYSPLPFWDYWAVVQHLPKYRAFDIRVLWEQHNEHRIVFPEIIFALDMVLAHGRQILPLVISFICYFSTWLVMSWTIFSDEGISRRVRYTAILLAGIVIGWQGSAVALATPFLLPWSLAQFVSVLALALVGPLKETSRIIYLVGIIGCGIIATYSSANGLLLWPVILTAGFLSSLDRHYMLGLATAAALSITLYFVGYHLSGRLSLSNVVSHPLYLIEFLSSYVSMPFGLYKAPEFGVYVGFANLVLFCWLVAISARLRLLACPPAIVVFGSFAFILLSALLTAAGRMNPQDMTFTAAKASRYLTMPMVNWGALIIALIWVSERCRWKIKSSTTIALAALVLSLATLPKPRGWFSQNDTAFARQQWAALSLENGLFDPEIGRYVFPNPASLKPLLATLRSNHLSVFFSEYNTWLGEPVRSKFSEPSNAPLAGEVRRTLPIPGGLEVLGWADGPRYQRMVFVNDSGRIVGFGRKLPAGFPYDLQSPDMPSSLGWVGFVNSRFESQSFSTYVMDLRSRRIAPIGGPSPVPATAAAALDEAGHSMADPEWRMNPRWKLMEVMEPPEYIE